MGKMDIVSNRAGQRGPGSGHPSPEQELTKIVIADAHDLVREAVAAYVKDLWPDAEVVQAGSVAAVRQIVAGNGGNRPSVMILDYALVEANDLEGIRNLSLLLPEVPIVILADKADYALVVSALKAGAKGFIPKTMRPAAMICAVKLVMSGEVFVPASVLGGAQNDEEAASAGAVCAPSTEHKEQNPLLSQLTQRELAVLHQLAQGASNKEIARNLLIQEITVKSHMKSIFRKLNTRNRTQAAKIALECNLSLSG